MKNILLRPILLVALGALALGARAAGVRWEDSIVTVEVTRKDYDFLQPWTKRVAQHLKTGVVVAPGRVLTTAEHLNDLTLVRIQKGGHGQWCNGALQWIDYHANLALVTATATNLWRGLKPARLADPVPLKGNSQFLRWHEGNLEKRKAEIARVTVKRGYLSFLDLPFLEADSEINQGGRAEALVSDTQLLGLACAQDKTTCTVIPASFIRFVFQAADTKPPRRLGFFDFVWQRTENTAIHAYLGLPGEPRGVVVTDYATGAGKSDLVRPHDLILEVEGFKVDTAGNYTDPHYGQLLLENLATRGKWAGDTVRLVVWRQGAMRQVDYPLPAAEYGVEMVPQAVYDREPEFLMVGGLIFQPLTEAYLRSWGGDWRRKAPFRLGYYEREKPTPERRARVVLSLVLPDPFNLGYEDYHFMALDKVNGQPISRLSELAAALRQPKDGYHFLEFGAGESLRRMVIDAAEAEAATRRVMQQYRLDKDRFLASEQTAGPARER